MALKKDIFVIVTQLRKYAWPVDLSSLWLVRPLCLETLHKYGLKYWVFPVILQRATHIQRTHTHSTAFHAHFSLTYKYIYSSVCAATCVSPCRTHTGLLKVFLSLTRCSGCSPSVRSRLCFRIKSLKEAVAARRAAGRLIRGRSLLL